jgi:hypothetical protein
MPNKRIFYASQGVSVNGDTVQGAQSVSINTNFNLEQIFQLGRLALYDNFPTDPEVEVTLSKILDGHGLIFTYFAGGPGANSLVSTANDTAEIVLHVDEDNKDFIAGVATASVTMTGCFLSSLNYTFPVDGSFTEELTFVGSHKAAGGTVAAPGEDPDLRVLRRQNFQVGDSTLPSGIYGKCITNITVSADLGREKMFCLGSYAPFHRYVNFPLEITVAFDITQDGNGGDLAGPDFDVEELAQCEAGNFIQKEEIILNLCDSEGDTAYTFDFGSGAALQSVSYSGGDTGGGNVTETWTYLVYNELTITDSNP